MGGQSKTIPTNFAREVASIGGVGSGFGENALDAADDGEGHDDEPDFNLGPVDDARGALGGGDDGGMLDAGAGLWLIPSIVDFPELAALHLAPQRELELELLNTIPYGTEASAAG